MPKYKFDQIISADTIDEANEKYKLIQSILKHLKTEELKKVADVVSNPLQLAVIKAKFM